ncbi:MAG: hypothetical protein OEO77_07240 [Acidimicrobiia bacterium]|nr:hypothetical protein [Acidimicrobiia bacterium]
MSGPRLWLVLFAALLVTHLDFLTVPAGLDATWSVMAGAETLASNGFSYTDLLGRPGLLEGGPSTHATSIVTFVTALVLVALGPGVPALVALHLIQLAVGATGLWFTFRLACRLMSARQAWIITIAVALTPIIFTQMGSVYLETPMLTAAMGAFWFAEQDRPAPSAVAALLAVAVKPSGIAVVGTILLVGLITNRRRLGWQISLFLAAGALVLFTGQQYGLDQGTPFDWPEIQRFWRSQAGFLAATPMTLAVAFAHTGASIWWWKRRVQRRSLDYLAVFPWVFVGQHVLGVVAGQTTNLLPRYWAVALPAMLITTGVWLVAACSTEFVRVVTVGYVGVALIGLAGYLGPDAAAPDFILAERAPTSRQLIRLEKVAIAELVASDATVLATLDTSFRLEYPAAGYVDARHEGHLTVPGGGALLSGLPDHVIFIERDGSPRNTLLKAQLGPGWTIETHALQKGRFTIRIVEAWRR